VQPLAAERSESGGEPPGGFIATVQGIARQQVITTNPESNQTPSQISVGTSFAQRRLDESVREMAKDMT